MTVTIGQNGYTTEVRTCDHVLLSDEPLALGGDNKGLTPFELMLASLGSCTLMTMRSYADRKGWEVSSIGCTLEHSRVPARECPECLHDDGLVTKITRSIEITGDLTQDKHERLMEIADKGPVYRSLTSELLVSTTSHTNSMEAHA
ncbi:MAG: OsmC family protein [Planctomycetota bacterium]